MKDPIIEKVRDVIGQRLDVVGFAPQASLVEHLGADSLHRIEIIMDLEEAFGIEISDDEAEAVVTVQDALDLVMKKAAANA